MQTAYRCVESVYSATIVSSLIQRTMNSSFVSVDVGVGIGIYLFYVYFFVLCRKNLLYLRRIYIIKFTRSGAVMFVLHIALPVGVRFYSSLICPVHSIAPNSKIYSSHVFSSFIGESAKYDCRYGFAFAR